MRNSRNLRLISKRTKFKREKHRASKGRSVKSGRPVQRNNKRDIGQQSFNQPEQKKIIGRNLQAHLWLKQKLDEAKMSYEVAKTTLNEKEDITKKEAAQTELSFDYAETVKERNYQARQSLKHNEAYERILNLIAKGDISFYTSTTVTKLRDEIDFSNRGPVREAVHMLVSRNILERQVLTNGKDKLRLKSLSSSDIDFLSKMRREAEFEVIQKFIENASEEDILNFNFMSKKFAINFSLSDESRLTNAHSEKAYHVFFAKHVQIHSSVDLISQLFDSTIMVTGEHYKSSNDHIIEHNNLSSAIKMALEDKSSGLHEVKLALDAHIMNSARRMKNIIKERRSDFTSKVFKGIDHSDI